MRFAGKVQLSLIPHPPNCPPTNLLSSRCAGSLRVHFFCRVEPLREMNPAGCTRFVEDLEFRRRVVKFLPELPHSSELLVGTTLVTGQSGQIFGYGQRSQEWASAVKLRHSEELQAMRLKKARLAPTPT